MKLHILSDLHIEFADFTVPKTDADVVVLAGDIGVGVGGLDWLRSQRISKPVMYVPGNHEYYNNDTRLIDALCREAPLNVYVLNNDSVEIDGVRFLGCTLWTDFALFGEADKFFSMQHARKNMADFSLINHGGVRFSPEDSIALHCHSRDWLKLMLADDFEGKSVVVTHHAPSFRSVHPRFARDLLTPAFSSNLEELMNGSQAALWVHGHTHDAFDYEIKGTRVLCNPRGYVPYENSTGFVADLVVEV